MAPPYPRDPVGTAAAAGVIDCIKAAAEAAAEAQAEEEAQLPPERTEEQLQLAVPVDWHLMLESSDEEGSDDEEDEEGSDEEEEPGEAMETDAQPFSNSFEYFAEGKPEQDDVIESLANARYLFPRRWSFPNVLQVTVKGIDSLMVSEDMLELIVKLEAHGWTIRNVDRLRQAARLDKGLQQLQRGLRLLRTSMKKRAHFEGVNTLGNLVSEIEGWCTLQPASTRGAVLVITASVASVLASATSDSPPYDELTVSAENLWGSVHAAREEAVTYIS